MCFSLCRKFADTYFCKGIVFEKYEVPHIIELGVQVRSAFCRCKCSHLYGVQQVFACLRMIHFCNDSRVVFIGNISVYISNDAIDPAAAGVLPDAVWMFAGAFACVLCNPFVIGGQLCRVEVAVEKVFGAVQHGIVSSCLHLIQERFANLGVGLFTAAGVDALILDVKGDWVGQLVRFYCPNNLLRCPACCLYGGGIAVQINANIQSCRQRTLDVLGKGTVEFERTVVVAEAHTDDSKVNAVRFDFLPVHLGLPF